MQVILLEKVINLGNLGDIVKVKDGYARNFLIPGKKARRATQTAIAEFQVKRAELEKVAAEKLAVAQGEGEKLNGLTVQIIRKSGVDGRLFGSVTHADIAEAVGTQGFKLEKGAGSSAERPAEGCERPPGQRCAAYRGGGRRDRVRSGRARLSACSEPGN